MANTPYKKSRSTKDLLDKHFEAIPLPKELHESLGEFSEGSSIIIWGKSGSGKSTFAMRLMKAFCEYGKCYWNEVEQAGRKSFALMIEREGLKGYPMEKVAIGLADSWEDMVAKLKRNKAKFVFLNSLQFMRFDQFQFKELTKKYPRKCFIVISHGGTDPKGEVASEIQYDVDLKIRVSEGVAYPDSRMGGGKPYRIFFKDRGKGTLALDFKPSES